MKTVNFQSVNLQVVNLQSVKNLLDLSPAHCGHLAKLHWPARYVVLYFQQLTVPGSGWVLEFCQKPVNLQTVNVQFVNMLSVKN